VKKFQRNAISVGLLSVLLVSLVFMLSGCGFLSQGPTAGFTYSPNNPKVDEEITFDASNSSASNGSITDYQWDFNDDGSFSDTGKTQTHSYSSTGDYNVTLKVTDDNGKTDSISKTVSVQSKPGLKASFTMSPEPGEVNQAVSFDASGSTGNIDSYTWEYGDGDVQSGPSLVDPDHVYNQTGSYTVQLTVKDGQGDLSISGELLEVQTS